MRDAVFSSIFIPVSIVIPLFFLSFRRPKGGRISEASTEYIHLCVTEILRFAQNDSMWSSE